MSAIGLVGRAARLHPQLVDLSSATVIFAVAVLTAMTGPAGVSGGVTGRAVVLAALACGVLVARRSYPIAVLVISVLATEAYLAQTHDRGDMLLVLAPLIALYTVVDVTTARLGLLIGVLAVLALAGVHVLAGPSSWWGSDNLALAALGALAVSAGAASRNRRAYLAEVEQRAHRAERTRESEALRRVTEERLRIAHDLHDSVGHHLALINIQAEVAGYLLETEPDQAREALAHVGAATRDALRELHATIGLLRQPGEAPAATTRPAIGLAGLGELIAAYRRSGLSVDLDIEGTVRQLSPPADLTAYRVIQESLTNVCKHTTLQRARIQLTYETDLLAIAIDDDGLVRADDNQGPAAGADVGHGIVGMRERVAALGGALRVGRRPSGGFKVRVTLPFEEPAT